MVCSHLIHCGYAFFVVLYRFFVDQRVHLYNSSIANTKTQKTSRDTAPLRLGIVYNCMRRALDLAYN